MWPWILSGASLLAGAVAVLYLRWRLQRAEDSEHVWQAKALQLVKDMTAMVAAAREERTRQEGVIRELRSQLDLAERTAAGAALADPAAADRYVLGSLREAAAAADPAPHPDVPGPAPAGPAPAGDRGGHR